MRIGIVGFLHESNSFAEMVTTREDFEACSLDIGAALLDRWTGTHHELGGFIAGAEQFDFEPVPIVAAVAVPSGRVTKEAFESIWSDMVAGLDGCGPLDGLLLGLHGATYAEHVPDADGEIVQRIRDRVGPDLPIVMSLDLHTNLSPRMVEGVNATVLYRTVPHVDQFRCGLEAASILARAVRGIIRPVQAVQHVPMLMDVTRQDTDQEPASLLIAELDRSMQEPKILSAGIGFGFCHADVKELFTSIVVTADGDAHTADAEARRIADQVWSMRDRFVGDEPKPGDAVRIAVEMEGQPIVVSDLGDNVGGGARGDSTVLLQEILRQGIGNTLIVLWDPDNVQACARASIGDTLELCVGGKGQNDATGPIPIRGRLRTMSDGHFIEPQPRHGGRRENYQGLTAVLEAENGHTIVLTSLRMAPFGLHQILSLGIDPAAKKIIIVKAAIAHRAAYAPVAAHFLIADTPGATTADLASRTYRHRPCPLFPLETDAEYVPTA